MKRLFDCADRYIQSRDWKMLAGLKFCLCAIGILLGLSVPGKHKKCAAAGAIPGYLYSLDGRFPYLRSGLFPSCDKRM